MNQLIFDKCCLENNTYVVCTDALILEHVNKILKSKIGDTLKVAVLDEGYSQAEIIDLNSNKLELKLIGPLEKNQSPNINLFIGACRPPSAKKILEHGATFGVKSFTFFKAELSEKSYLSSNLYQTDQYNKYLKQGLSQSGKYYELPKVNLLTNQKTLFSEISEKNKTFLLSLNAHEKLSAKSISAMNEEEMNIIIGPERGLTPAEEQSFISAGASPIKIAQTILRSEYAVLTILGQLEYLKIKA